MRKLTHKITFGLSLILFFVSLQASAKRSIGEKSKAVQEEHSITTNHNILITNKFGKVNISSWDKNAVSLDIEIIVKHPNEKKAQEILDKIEIDIKKTDTEFRVYTRIKGEKDNYRLNSNKGSSITIDYNLNLPKENQLYVKNSFGDLILGSRNGNTKVDVSFGSATIGNLSGEQNQLNFQFSEPVVVNSLTSGNIQLKHSKLELLRSEDLILSSEMSNAKIDRLEKGQIVLKLGSIEMNEVKTLRLNSQMSSVKIDKLHEKGNIQNNYGSLAINTISQKIKELEIIAEFSPINIQLERAGNYKLNAIAKMGELKLPPNSIQEKSKNIEDAPLIEMNKNFKGHIGTNNSEAGIIKISNSFGEINVTLTD